MIARIKKTGLPLLCLALSLAAHILSVYSWRLFRTYEFATPVTIQQPIAVGLTGPPPNQSTTDLSNSQKPRINPKKNAPAADVVKNNIPKQTINSQKLTQLTSDTTSNDVKSATSSSLNHEAPSPPHTAALHTTTVSPLLGNSHNFLATASEKLTYQVSMLGIPVGSAELEAKNDNGTISLSLKIQSNAAFSNIYPVNNSIETRHVDGRFIFTRIKQQEGTFRSDEELTINQGRKSVSWASNTTGRSLKASVPAEDVFDTLSGIYLLRNRLLQPGTTEKLHIFDSETYADVPVDILRRELILLPNMTEVNTIVVRPLQKTAGIFRRTGDIFIWLTDDDFKVPVKIVTIIALGRVTAELISAETIPVATE